jgi:hypothetical protein
MAKGNLLIAQQRRAIMENSVFNNVDDVGNALEDGAYYGLYDPDRGVDSIGPVVRYDASDDIFLDIDGFEHVVDVDMYGGSLCFARRQKQSTSNPKPNPIYEAQC